MELFGVFLPAKDRLSRYLREVLSGRGGIVFYLSLAGVLAGGFGVGSIFVLGHGHTINTSSLVPWGLQISTYVFFALVSGGCIFTNFLGNMFFAQRYQPLASRIIFLGLICALAGFLSLASELGHVERMYMFLVSPNPTSPMFWMSVWYSADIAILVVEYVNVQRRHHSKAMLYASFIIPVVTYCSLGSLFGAVGSVPYYYGAMLPIYFLFCGFLSGNALCGIVAALYAVRRGDRSIIRPFLRMQKIGLSTVLVLSFCRIIIGLANHVNGQEVFKETLTSNLLLGVLAGLVVPFVILMRYRKPWALLLSGVIVLITQFMSRVDLVVEGFRVPLFRVYEMPARIDYFPSVMEMLVVVASVSIVALLYVVCENTGLFEVANKEAH